MCWCFSLTKVRSILCIILDGIFHSNANGNMITGQTAFGLGFVILICACAITLHSDYMKDDQKKLGRLKYYCIISMVLICFHLGIAGFRLEKYYDAGERFAVITLVNFVAAEFFLTYSIIRTMTTLKKTKERTPLTNQPTVWKRIYFTKSTSFLFLDLMTDFSNMRGLNFVLYLGTSVDVKEN